MYKGIEGARGWLAWIVVASHLVAVTPLAYLPAMTLLLDMASWSVEVFIIISGFVITHVLVEKREGYIAYIARRALRIYPAYLIALGLGVAVIGLQAELVAKFPMQPPHAIHRAILTGLQIEQPVRQFLLDLALAQGLSPQTQFGYVPVAWSLSLEWQYYLVAPLFLTAVRARPVATCVGVLVAVAAYRAGLLGAFLRPSILFGAGWLFLIGTLSRLWFDRLPAFGAYPAPMLLALAPILFGSPSFVPAFAWLALLAYMRSEARWRVLDGAVARYMGSRSYAVYVLHYAAILLVGWLAWGVIGLGTRSAILATCAGTGVAVLAAAELVHRWVERPAISFGRGLGREPGPASQGW